MRRKRSSHPGASSHRAKSEGPAQHSPPTALHYRLHLREKHMPTREDAWKLLCEYTASESLRKHMLAVEACVRAYARKAGADEETWGLAALLHDFDYERWPNQEHSPDQGHPSEGAKILREQGYPEQIVRAIITHADYCGVPLEEHIGFCIAALREHADALGVRGTL